MILPALRGISKFTAGVTGLLLVYEVRLRNGKYDHADSEPVGTCDYHPMDAPVDVAVLFRLGRFRDSHTESMDILGWNKFWH